MEIIKELLVSYGLTPDEKTIDVVHKIIELGFDNCWLRNMSIIKEFDELYKTDVPLMDIYKEISLSNQDLSVNSIRKIIRERNSYII